MNRNVELLERVMQHIDDHPEQHEQAVWVRHECGTAACFAGWAALLSDEMTEVEDRTGLFRDAGGELFTAREAAGQVLGVDGFESGELFDANNTRDMLRLMVKDLVNGDDLQPADYYRAEVES